MADATETRNIRFDWRVQTGNMRGVRMALFIVGTMLSVTAAAAQGDAGADHVKVDLLTDATVVRPGQRFTVGVRFKIDPGWHIYWTNPGDSGLPTRVSLDLPQGLTAGPTEYPVPSVLRFPGNIVNYGYEREIVLLVPVTATAATSGRITVKADYLVCSDNCLPGRATVTLDLPTAAADAATVRHWAALLPKPPPADFSAAYSRKAPPADASYHVTVRWPAGTLPTGGGDDAVQWLPPATPGFDVADIHVATRASVTEIDYTMTPTGKRPPPSSVEGLLLYTPAAGGTIGIRLPIYPGQAAGSLPITDFYGGGS